MTFAPRHILVPIDVTEQRDLAERLVDDACAMARRFDSTVTLIYATGPSPKALAPDAAVTASKNAPAARALMEIAAAHRRNREQALDVLTQRARATGVVAKSLVVASDDSIPEAIAKTAQSGHADLIVMTTHARRGLSRALLGSVAERTAHLATVPVLLIPPP